MTVGDDSLTYQPCDTTRGHREYWWKKATSSRGSKFRQAAFQAVLGDLVEVVQPTVEFM